MVKALLRCEFMPNVSLRVYSPSDGVMLEKEQVVPLVHISGLRSLPVPGSHWLSVHTSRPGLEISALDIVAGRCYAVIGKSGAGKSVLNSLLVGYPAFACSSGASSGRGCWWGRVPLSVKTLGSRFRMHRWRQMVKRYGSVLYLPQQMPDGIDYSMSAEVYLRHVHAALCDECCIDAGRNLDFSDLGELSAKLGQAVNRLSGGERRRMELWVRLKVLSCRQTGQSRPALLVLDEPTTGLDLLEERRYLRMLRTRLAEATNVAAVVTTHALHLLDEESDDGLDDAGEKSFFDSVIVVRKRTDAGQEVRCSVSSAQEINALRRKIHGRWEAFLESPLDD